MYKSYIVEKIYNLQGKETEFSALYGIKEDKTAIIIDTDETDVIKDKYMSLTDINTNLKFESLENFEKWLILDDFFEWEYETPENNDNFNIIIEGKKYPYEMTLNPNIPDCISLRVNINGFFYHFG